MSSEPLVRTSDTVPDVTVPDVTVPDVVLNSAPVIVVPGLGGSDPGHWQTLWQHSHPHWLRTTPHSWTEPDHTDWLDAVARLVDASDQPPFLIGHSLGTLAAIDWTAIHPRTVAGLFLVAIPDPEAPSFPHVAPTFQNPHFGQLGVPTTVAYSTNDPYCAAPRAEEFARELDATTIALGDAGHINTATGYGLWPEGLDDLARLIAEATNNR